MLGITGPSSEMFDGMEPRAMMAAAPLFLAEAAPAAPTGVSAAATSPQSVNVRWTSVVAGATGYKVMRAAATGAFAEVGRVSGATTLNFADTSVSPNRQYRYQVVALGATLQSNPSATASVTTPMAAPANLTATIVAPTTVRLQWQNRDPSATAFVISRSVAGGAWATLVRVNGGTSVSYLDSTVSRGVAYAYRIQAVSGTVMSTVSASAAAAIPVAAPTMIRASVLPTSHVLSWTAGSATVTSYSIQRAVGSGAFTTLATVGRSVLAYTDSAIQGGATYSYRIVANGNNVPSAASATLRFVAALRAPGAPSATRGSDGVALKWTDANSTDVSYRIQRSLDGSTFTQVGTVAGSVGKSFLDTTAEATRQYWYRVQAYIGTASSAVSAATRVAAAPVTPPAPTPTPTPTPTPGSVSVTTRYGNELVVTLRGGSSSIRVSASGATLTIMSGGRVISEVAMPGSLFIYDRGGVNAIAIDSSVGVRTTVTSVGGGTTTITSAYGNVSAWIDTTDSFTGSGVVHSIATLAGSVAKTEGASLANPTDSGGTRKANATLWGSGPSIADINQGAVGDCYFLATIGAFASSNPSFIADRAVDLGDGTYIVQFTQGTNPVFVRVSNDLPTTNGTSYKFARPGTNGSVWAPVMEKAFAYFRTGANTYASISGGWMGDVFTAFGVASSAVWLNSTTEASLFSLISSALAAGQGVTFGTYSSPANLVGGHAYTLTSVRRDANGAALFTVRNPWGVSGTSSESSTGYAELTYAQMVANFQVGARAA